MVCPHSIFPRNTSASPLYSVRHEGARCQWRKVPPRYRFCQALYRYLEGQQELRCVIGFITNNRLLAKAAPLLEKAQRRHKETEQNSASSLP